MNKIFKCADMSFKCDWIATAKTESELMILIKDHAAKCHDLKEITKDISVTVKSVISDSKHDFIRFQGELSRLK